MSKRDLVGSFVAGDPHEHAAASAWLSLYPSGRRPSAVTILKQGKPTTKSSVYRLHGVLPGHVTVIGKRARRETALVERDLHGSVLPSLPVSRLEFFGATDEGPEQSDMWLFMQDAGDAAPTPEQRVCLARWLAQLHTSAADSAIVGAANLPDRGMAYYREHLERGRSRLRTLIAQGAAPSEASARSILEQNLALLDQIDAKWATLAALTDLLPSTLAHGDFVRKNVRICKQSGRPRVIVLDWETAGWGSPISDLATLSVAGFNASAVEFEAYTSTVQRYWPTIGGATVEQARRGGVVMRWIVAIDWAAYSLRKGWNAHAFHQLEAYAARLRSAVGSSEGVGLL